MKTILIAVIALLSVGCAAKKPQPQPVAQAPGLQVKKDKPKDVHAVSNTVKYVADLSPKKAVKDSAKASAKSVKESAKLATFPVRHPKKLAHGVAKVGKQIV